MRAHPLQPRLTRLRKLLQDEGLGALVSFGAADCRYLTGFTGEAVTVITTAAEVILLTDPRFTTQAEEEAPESKLVICNHDCDDQIPQVLVESLQAGGEGDTAVTGFDSDHLTVKRWERLRERLEGPGALRLKLVQGLVRRCRLVKFPDEIEAIRLAGKTAVQAFAYLESIPVVGRSERDVALDLEVFLRRNGSEGVAFPFIVAGGRRGALPHGAPSTATLELGGLLVLDIGAVTDGYSSDVTRTYAIGEVSADLVKAYETVREAQALAVAAVRPGTPGKEVDELARAHLRDAAMDDLFVHSLGHGVGLEVHEGPTLSWRSEDVLEAGMVVTVEPGIYLPGQGGVRIEDTVVVTPEGPDIVTDWPRELRTLSR